MLRAVHDSTLRGLQVHVDDLDAAAHFIGHVLGLTPLACAAEGELRFGLGSRWLAVRPAPAEQVDCLHWHSAALAAQRALLGQLGIDTADEAAEALQVSGVDTGACAAIWTEGPHAGTAGSAGSADAVPRLHALVLCARAPERVAAHWAQMLQAAPGRDARGRPQLRIDGVALSFAFSEDRAGGVREIALAHDRPEALQSIYRRADAAGVARSGDTLSLAGLTVRLV